MGVLSALDGSCSDVVLTQDGLLSELVAGQKLPNDAAFQVQQNLVSHFFEAHYLGQIVVSPDELVLNGVTIHASQCSRRSYQKVVCAPFKLDSKRSLLSDPLDEVPLVLEALFVPASHQQLSLGLDHLPDFFDEGVSDQPRLLLLEGDSSLPRDLRKEILVSLILVFVRYSLLDACIGVFEALVFALRVKPLVLSFLQELFELACTL